MENDKRKEDTTMENKKKVWAPPAITEHSIDNNTCGSTTVGGLDAGFYS